MTQEEIINELTDLISAIQKEDVCTIMKCINILRIDYNFSPLRNLITNFISKTIKEHIENTNEPLRIQRKGDCGIMHTDVYTIKDGIVYRNGNNIKWSALGKIYQAYKQIINK